MVPVPASRCRVPGTVHGAGCSALGTLHGTWYPARGTRHAELPIFPVSMPFLFNRRAGDGADHAELGLDSSQLEGDLRDPGPDEAPALRPFAAAIPLTQQALPEALPDEPEPVRVLRRVGDLEKLGRRLDATLVLRQAVLDAPDDVDLLLNLARVLEAEGEADEALAALELGLQATGSAIPVRIHRGALLARLGRHSEAEADLRAAMSAAPDMLEAHLHLGLSYLRRGKQAEAIPLFQRAADLAPDHPETVLLLGEAWYHVGRLDQAEATLLRATELAPNDPRAYKLLGRLLDRTGRTEEAMIMHRKAREAGAV